MFDQIKRGSSTPVDSDGNADPSEGDTVGKIRAETDSTKLKQFINNLGDD